MKRALQKPLASLVAFSLVLGLVPLHALADETPTLPEEPVALEEVLTEEPAPAEVVAPVEKEAPKEEVAPEEAPAEKTALAEEADTEEVAPAEEEATPAEEAAPEDEPAAADPAAPAEAPAPVAKAETTKPAAPKSAAPKLTPQATTIDRLSITVTPPEAGTRSTDAKPNVSVSTEGIASYTASWQDHTGVSSMEPETLDFVAGNTYYALITLHPAEGYAFKTSGPKSMDVYTNDTYYDGGLPASLDIVTVGIYSGNGQLRMLVRVKATEVQPKYLCTGVSEGGTYSVATSDPFPHENMDWPMNLSVNPGDSVTLTATPDEGYVFKGFYTGIRQMDSSKEGYGFVTDYDPNSLVSSANPYSFTINENTNIYALFAKPTLTLHWSSIDNADLIEPVVIENVAAGADVYDAIKAGLHMSQGPSGEATAQIAGYIESGYFTPEPMSSYSSRAELDDNNVLYVDVTEDMDVYVCMNKVIDDVKVGIEAPIAGYETTTPGDAYSSHTDWRWDEQTNRPYFSVPSGAKYQIAFDSEDPTYEPSYWMEATDKRHEFGKPFIGTFAAGETYNAEVFLKADFGYGFASANPYARDPEYSGSATVDGGAFENAFLDGIGYTDNLFLAVSVKAVPDASTHTVTFDTDGLFATPATQTVADGAKATSPTSPRRDAHADGYAENGLSFRNWYSKPAEEISSYWEFCYSPSSNPNGCIFDFDTPITQDTTAYAVYEGILTIKTYDVTNSQPDAGGKFDHSNYNSLYGSTDCPSGYQTTAFYKMPAFLKAKPAEGYVFAGWSTSTSKDDIISTEAEYEYTFMKRATIYALFEKEAPKYELSFAFTNLYPGTQPQALLESLTVNGEDWTPTSGNTTAKDIPAGSSVTATVKVTDNASLATYNNPENTISDLVPTYSDDGSKLTFTFTMPETDARIVVYLFEAVTVTYDANGGVKQPAWADFVKWMKYTASTPATINVSRELVDQISGQPRIQPPAGSTFAGIEVTQNKTGATVTGKPGETITGLDFSEGGTIKFLWAKDVTVTFDAKGGSPVPAEQKFKSGGTATEPADPAKTGWTFGGWCADKALEEPFSFDATVNDDTMLYARWNGQIDVSAYDRTNDKSDAGGTFDCESIVGIVEGLYSYGSGSIAEGSTVSLTATPAAGYRFAGWAKDSVDGTIVSENAAYSFTFEDNPTTLFAVFEEIPPKLTLHWTSVDGDDLVNPIAIESTPGTDVAYALNLYGGSSMATDIFANAKEGYVWSGHQMPKPLSAYKSMADLDAERVKGPDSIGKGLDIYYVMLKEIDAVEMSVEAPKCGVETKMVDNEQTNPPAMTLAGSNYGPAFEGQPVAMWGEWKTDHAEPFGGTFEGGKDYSLLALLAADFGYCFADDVTATVTGAKDAQPLTSSDSPLLVLGVSAQVTAEHTPGEPVIENEVKPTCTEAGSHDEVVYCTACNAEISRKTVTDPALGHDWGEWIVVKEATEEADGLEQRTCKRCKEVEERVIPKLVVEYTCAAGDGQTWTKGSGTTLEFTFKRSIADETCFSHFTGVRVDGKLLSAKAYTAKAGSTVVTLNAAYLETLAVGNHTLTAQFDDGNGEATATFTVAEKEAPAPTPEKKDEAKPASKPASGKLPQTGDTYALVSLTALTLALVGLAATLAGRRIRE